MVFFFERYMYGTLVVSHDKVQVRFEFCSGWLNFMQVLTLQDHEAMRRICLTQSHLISTATCEPTVSFCDMEVFSTNYMYLLTLQFKIFYFSVLSIHWLSKFFVNFQSQILIISSLELFSMSVFFGGVGFVVVNCSHFLLLLQNHWANFNQTWHKAS